MKKILYVDASGQPVNFPQTVVKTESADFNVIFDDQLKQQTAFNIGIFFSRTVLSDQVHRYPRKQRIAVLNETPSDISYLQVEKVKQNFDFIYTHQASLYNAGPPFYPLLFGTNWIVGHEVNLLCQDEILSKKHELLSFMGSIQHEESEAYNFRRQIANYTIKNNIPSFGKGIKPLESKREGIAPFFFSIAMENAASDFYFSEKLVDCLLLWTVPIYYGCPGIFQLLDSRGFITFNSLTELEAIIGGLTHDKYQQMLPWVVHNRNRIIEMKCHSHEGMLERALSHFSTINPDLDYTSIRYSTHTRSARSVHDLLKGRIYSVLKKLKLTK